MAAGKRRVNASRPLPAPVQSPVADAPVAVTVPAPVVAAEEPPVPPFVAAEPVEQTVNIEAAVPAALPVEGKIEEIVNQIVEKEAETMTDMNQNFQAAADAGNTVADRGQAMFGDINSRAKAAVEKSSKLFEEASELTKGNVEALVASSRIVAKGVESIGQDAAEYGRKSFEDASAMFKKFAEVKSPTELFKLQSDFARSAFDSLVSESSKMSETMLKLAGEVAEPLTSRYAVAAERVKNVAA